MDQENNIFPKEFIEEAQNRGYVLTRFPPEPNGYLHLGHVKAMEADFSFANYSNGKCIMRFDDTNPEAEKEEFFISIREDLNWLDYSPVLETYTSDYFSILYLYAIKLIQTKNAYICELSPENISIYRHQKRESPYKNRSIDESLKLFEEMKNGFHPENSMTLRLIGDLTSNNPCMYDPIMYRIKFINHYRTGSKWCIYPTYDFSHCIIDSLEGITHSFCTKEFEIRRELYYYFLDKLGLMKPFVYEFGRLNVEGYTLSKRKIKEMILNHTVTGWSDPLLLTVSGLRNKGYTSYALKEFCKTVNLTKNDAIISINLLNLIQQTELNNIAKRRMVVIDPLQLNIINFQELNCICLDFPTDKNSTVRLIPLTNTVFIERSSFREVDEKSFYGLAPIDTTIAPSMGSIVQGKIIRLKYGCFLEYVSHTTNVVNVKIVEPANPKKIKGILNWTNNNAVNIIVRQFDNMIVTEHKSLAEQEIQYAKPGDRYQFERHGYYFSDLNNESNEIKIFNEICPSRSTFTN
jgi:glutaminyl-tRNA synthetase